MQQIFTEQQDLQEIRQGATGHARIKCAFQTLSLGSLQFGRREGKFSNNNAGQPMRRVSVMHLKETKIISCCKRQETLHGETDCEWGLEDCIQF